MLGTAQLRSSTSRVRTSLMSRSRFGPLGDESGAWRARQVTCREDTRLLAAWRTRPWRAGEVRHTALAALGAIEVIGPAGPFE